MERNGIEWEQLGTHHEHLSVLDYKKEQQTEEVAALEETIAKQQEELNQLADKTLIQQSEFDKYAAELENVPDKLKATKIKEKFVADNARRCDDDPEFQLVEPKPLMSAKTYYEKVAAPLDQKLKTVIRSILLQFFEKTRKLQTELDRANGRVDSLSSRLKKQEADNTRLRTVEQDYQRLRQSVGEDTADRLIREKKAQEIPETPKRKTQTKQEYVR